MLRVSSRDNTFWRSLGKGNTSLQPFYTDRCRKLQRSLGTIIIT